MIRDELIAALRRILTSGALAGERGLTEKKMFGGVGFLLNGNLLAGTGGGGFVGALLLRVGKAGEAEALRQPHARPMAMGGRRIGGYVFVDPPGWRDESALTRWLQRALDHVRTLPPKKPAAVKAKKAKAAAKPKLGAKAKTKRKARGR